MFLRVIRFVFHAQAKGKKYLREDEIIMGISFREMILLRGVFQQNNLPFGVHIQNFKVCGNFFSGITTFSRFLGDSFSRIFFHSRK